MAEITIDWDMINSITQILMTIATFAAVLIALEPSTRKVIVHFYMKNYNFEYFSWSKNKSKLFITNPSSKVIIIYKIVISAKKIDFINIEKLSLDVAYIDLLSDEFYRPIILTIDGKNYVEGQPLVVLPNQTTQIALSFFELHYVFGHYIDEPNNANKDWIIRIALTDINKKTYKLKTDITFKEYYDILNYAIDNFDKKDN